MLQLSRETENLARRVAIMVGRRPEDLIQSILEREARELGMLAQQAPMRKAAVEELLEFGRRAAKRPVLDNRSLQEIVDDINKL